MGRKSSGIVCNDSPVTGILDTYGDAFVAYSLYKLRNDYTGPCMRVQRESDNELKDIGWHNGFICVAELEDFANGENLRVNRWYNQSARTFIDGNPITLFRVAVLAGPLIALAGVFIPQGIKNVGVNADRLLTATNSSEFAFMHNGTRFTSACAFKINDLSASNNLQTIFTTSNLTENSVGYASMYENRPAVATNCARIFVARGAAGLVCDTRQSSTLLGNTDTIMVTDNDMSNATASQRAFFDVNGTTYSPNTSTNPPSLSTTNQALTLNSFGTFHSNGYMKELIIWDTDKSVSMSGIRDNINSRWNIY